MVKSRRTFTRDFKEEAVRLAEGSERTAAEIARDLGIHPNLIYRWRKELATEGDEAFPGQGKLKPSDEEVMRLRKELERVRQERDILKKALVFFAEESK
jgi:transposase